MIQRPITNDQFFVASVVGEFAALLSAYQHRPPRGGTTLEIGVRRLDGMPFE
jgi:hypothetical protein